MAVINKNEKKNVQGYANQMRSRIDKEDIDMEVEIQEKNSAESDTNPFKEKTKNTIYSPKILLGIKSDQDPC